MVVAHRELWTGGVFIHPFFIDKSVYYNPLQPCIEPQSSAANVGRALAQVRALRPSELPQLDDLTTLRALRDLFTLSPAGQRYINMYYQYAPETGGLALANPALLRDGYRTLQNFLPGFKSLAAGNGNDIVITQPMVGEVNNIADRLVAVGSRSLRSAINQERANYSNLQVFVGKTFNQAASTLGITTTSRIYLPLIER